MRHWDLFWLASNKVTIFRSLLDLTASVLYNLAAVHQPSKEPQLPCGTQLHNMLGAVIFGPSCGGCSCCCRCLSPPSQRRNRKRRKLASDENYPLCTLTGAVHGKWWLAQWPPWQEMGLDDSLRWRHMLLAFGSCFLHTPTKFKLQSCSL